MKLVLIIKNFILTKKKGGERSQEHQQDKAGVQEHHTRSEELPGVQFGCPLQLNGQVAGFR